VKLAQALPFPVNLWQVQNLFFRRLRILARKSGAVRRQAPEAIVASDLAKLGETLLFTPQALDTLLRPAPAD
jgi:hypothetical protein